MQMVSVMDETKTHGMKLVLKELVNSVLMYKTVSQQVVVEAVLPVGAGAELEAVIRVHGHVMELPLIKPQEICLHLYGVSLNNAGYSRGGNTQVEIAVVTDQH